MKTDYQLVDVDNHYYEPDDCFTRYIKPEFADRAVNIRRGEDGLGRIYIGDSRLSFHSVIQTDHIGAPGTLRGYFADGEDKAWRAAKGRTGVGGEVTERPSDVFRRHVFVSPFPEDDILTLPQLVTIAKLFGATMGRQVTSKALSYTGATG